jgi:hypothetical protein
MASLPDPGFAHRGVMPGGRDEIENNNEEKYIVTQRKRTGMKYLLFIVLLVAGLITTGCVGDNKNSVVTPTPQIIFETVRVTQTVIQSPKPQLFGYKIP